MPLVNLQDAHGIESWWRADELIVKVRRGVVSDAYYFYQWGNPVKGTHQIEAILKDVKTNTTQTYKKTFLQN